MNRRGFLGFFGAGAVAGPRLAAGIAEEVASSSPAPFYSGISNAEGQTASEACGGWRQRRIAQLRRVISGKDPSIERNQKLHVLYTAEQRERVRLDGLRSVSPAAKMRMLVDGNAARQRRIQKTEAGFNLADFLKGEV